MSACRRRVAWSARTRCTRTTGAARSTSKRRRPGTFTLGQFFHIWGQPLDRTNIAGIVGLPITVYIVDEGNTAATEYTGDLPNIDLPAHRQITIQIGTAITTIPVYDFDGA